jgi:sugar lactone lactonase YvrE
LQTQQKCYIRQLLKSYSMKNPLIKQTINALLIVGLCVTLVKCKKDNEDPAPQLTIASLSSASGEVGASVTITGTGFSATASENIVMFNGITAIISTATATELNVVVPEGATTGKVTVTVNGETATSETDFTVISLAITNFTPPGGIVGTEVTITGVLFSTTPANNAVTFNDVAATVTSATATELKVMVPDKAGIGPIKITVNGKTVTSTASFNYEKSLRAVSTLAGSTLGFAEGQGSAARFKNPYGVAVDASGNVYVGDDGNHRIRKITSGGLVSTLAGSGVAGFADGQGTAAQFYLGAGVTIDASGNVYVADQGNSRIRKITPAGLVTTLAGSATYGFAEGQGSDARFADPTGVAVDAAGNVYVADKTNFRIRKITPGGLVSTLAGGTVGFVDGQGTAARFYYPYGVGVDATGNVYVADADNHSIRKITPGGLVTTLAGSGAAGFADGQGSVAQFNFPSGVAVDNSGNVYVADNFNHRIRKITPGGLVTTLAGGAAGFADGQASVAQFNRPYGITLDALGNIYIGDTFNNRIRKIAFE